MFDYKDTSKERLDNHVSHIVDLVKSIELGKVTILTGGNALGKSVIRKQIAFKLDKLLTEQGVAHDINHLVASTSMQLRTESRPEWGGLSTMTHDTPWCSTSETTVHLIKALLKESDKKKKYIVIDELEIGMSREVQVGMCQYLNEHMQELLDKTYGVLVITHSEDVVKTLKHDNWINIEGMSEDEWLNREIVPVDPDDLKNWALELFKAIRDRENDNKKKKDEKKDE